MSKIWLHKRSEWWRVLSLPMGLRLDGHDSIALCFGIRRVGNSVVVGSYASVRVGSEYTGWNWTWELCGNIVVIKDRWGVVLWKVHVNCFKYCVKFGMRELMLEDGLNHDWLDLRCLTQIMSAWIYV